MILGITENLGMCYVSLRAVCVTLCSGQVLSQPVTAFAHASKACILFKDSPRGSGEGWSPVSSNSPPPTPMQMPKSCLQDFSVLLVAEKLVGDSKGALQEVRLGQEGLFSCLGADPGCRGVRFQKGEMVKPWIYQESGICAICLFLLKTQILWSTVCSSCAAQGEICGCC